MVISSAKKVVVIPLYPSGYKFFWITTLKRRRKNILWLWHPFVDNIVDKL